MTLPYSGSPDNIDLSQVWRSVRASLFWLVPLGLMAGAVTYFLLSVRAPYYSAQAQIAINARSQPNPFAEPSRDQLGSDVAVRMDREAINTHIAAIQSPDLAEKIARDMNLTQLREFNSALGPVDDWSRWWRYVGLGQPKPHESDIDRALTAFGKSLQVFSPKDSRTITVRFTSVDPDRSAAIANRLVKTYSQTLSARAIAENGSVVQSLKPQIDELAIEVSRAEQAAQEFRGQANIFALGQQSTDLHQQQLAELSAELTRATALAGEVEARTEAARLHLDAGAAELLPDVQRSPLIQGLVASRVRVQRQLAELSATLLPGHPRMRQLSADLGNLKRQIHGEVEKIVRGLEKEAAVARSRQQLLETRIDEVKARIVKQSPDDVQLKQLEAAARSKRSELERLQAQFEATRARVASKALPVEVQVMAWARRSATPVFPRKLPSSFAAGIATVFLGFAIAFTRALVKGAGSEQSAPEFTRSSRYASAREVEAEEEWLGAMNAPLVAATSQAANTTAARPASAPMPPVTALSSMQDLIRALNTRPASSGQGGLRVMIAGMHERKDAAREALELAEALSADGRKVLLIDWRPGVAAGCAQLVGIEPEVGLTEVLSGASSFDSAVRALPSRSVTFLAGGLQAGPGFEFDKYQLSMALGALDGAFDFIVITGRYREACALFEALDGRFDVTVGVGKESPDSAHQFLGCDVAGRRHHYVLDQSIVLAYVPTHRLREVAAANARRNDGEAESA